LKAPSEHPSPKYPHIDERGAIQYSALEVGQRSLRVSEVLAVTLTDRNRERIDISEFAARNMDWTLALTDERVTVLAPQVAGFFGGVATKPGRVTAGHIAYPWISLIGFHPRGIVVATDFRRVLGDRLCESVTINVAGPEDWATLVQEFGDRLTEFWREQGVDPAPLAREFDEARAKRTETGGQFHLIQVMDVLDVYLEPPPGR